MEKEKFVPNKFAPLPFFILSHPKLTSVEKIIFACFEYFHFIGEKEITSKKIAAIIGLTFDRVRRVINDMCRKFADDERVSIKTISQGFNLPDVIVVHLRYKDQGPMLIDTHKVPYLEIKFLKEFIKKSKYFADEDPHTLFSVTKAPLTEIQKAIVYVDSQKVVKNPIGYLLRCFNEERKFHYEKSTTQMKRIEGNRIKGNLKIADAFLYAVKEKDAQEIAYKLKPDYTLYGYSEAGEKIIYFATYHGKPASVFKILKDNNVYFSVLPMTDEALKKANAVLHQLKKAG